MKKAQISAEFLVILGVVLLVALVAVGLAMFFTESSWQISQSEIAAYWATQAHPIRVIEMQGYYYASFPNSGEVAVLLENVDSKPITIKSFVIEPYGTETTFTVYAAHSSDGGTGGITSYGTAGAGSLNGLDVDLAPSERKAFYLRTAVACSDSGTTDQANSDKFYNDFTIYYDTPYFPNLSFKGIKPITSKCTPS
ncbi:MAG: class III signal peptide-containing protein [Candidatus Micrarchaeota archaeon]